MRNNEFLEQYVDGYYTQGAHGRMAYKDGRLISYRTTICDIDRRHKKAVVNVKKYSSTTSRMQNYLLVLPEANGYEIVKYEGEDAYIWDRFDARDWKVSIEDVR